jgi:thiol-disulfide isomerase/thioredoxin
MKFIYFLLYFGLYVNSAFGHSDTDTVWMNLKAYSKQLTYYSHDYSNDIFLAGNYVSEQSQFKIVIQLEKKQSKIEPIYFFVNSIENDSVIVGLNITCGLYKKVKIIEAQNCQFRIVKVSDDFDYVILEECRLQVPDIKLYNNRIPEIEIEGVFEKSINLSSLTNKGKLIYVEFWGLWCQGCLNQMPELKSIYDINSDNLEVVLLNYRNNKEDIVNYLTDIEFNCHNGITTDYINRLFFVNGYPFGVLFSEKGELIKLACSLEDLKYILNK